MSSTAAEFIISPGAIMISNGGTEINDGSLINHGFFQITRNSTFTNKGDFQIQQSANVSGNGYYKIEQDWINNGVYFAGLSQVELYGNLKQEITSLNNTYTEFHDLILSGNGLNENRKKELLITDAGCNATGHLYLNDRELSTLTNSFFIKNTDNSCVQYDASFQDEGFVSSLQPGFFWRATNNLSTYLFPVGSSEGTRRFRPIEINSNSQNPNNYAVRFNNYKSDLDNLSILLTDGFSKELNPIFYHSIKGNNPSVSLAKVNIGYLAEDGDYTGIANWHQDKWISFFEEYPNSIGNYKSINQDNIDLYSLDQPYILGNTDLSSDVYVPNTFTPDGSEYNNTFYPVFSDNSTFSDVEFYIFNRWGELIYFEKGFNPSWDGYYNNIKCQDGVYTWKLNYLKGNQKKYLVGHVNLIK